MLDNLNLDLRNVTCDYFSCICLQMLHSSSAEPRKSAVAKTFPTYINKYEGRSNGGIPCFSEERLQERAAKVSTFRGHNSLTANDSSAHNDIKKLTFSLIKIMFVCRCLFNASR